MTKYVKCTVIEPDDKIRPYIVNVDNNGFGAMPRTKGPINIKQYFIGKYQTRSEWYQPCGVNLNALV